MLMFLFYFTGRFLLEFVKEYQALSSNFPLTMGQVLSTPIVLGAIYLLFFSDRFGARGEDYEEIQPQKQAKSNQKRKGKSKKRK